MRSFGDGPQGPFRPQFWRSPLRGPWLTSILGSLLLPLLIIVGVTGFASHVAYMPQLGANAIVPRDGSFDFLLFDWPTTPSWLYAALEGYATRWLGVSAALFAVSGLAFMGRAAARRRRGDR